MNHNHFVLSTFFILMLTGCATTPSQQHLSLDETLHAKSLSQQGQYKQAASLYQSLALSKPTHQDQFNLLASEAFIQSGNSQSALSHATSINSAALSADQRNRLNLLFAQIYLSNGEAELALNQLSIIQPYNLKTSSQIVFYQSLAFAYSLTGDQLSSAQARIQLSPLLQTQDQQYKNNQVILNTLSLLPVQTLILGQAAAPDVLGGWMALTRLLKVSRTKQSPAKFQTSLNEWQRTFYNHPANNHFLQNYLQGASNNFKLPAAIAIFLPESGRFAVAANIIKEGFLAAYQQPTTSFQPSIRFYDSSTNSPVSLYHQALSEGAELIIGPLSKENIQTLALTTDLTVPVLALNHIQNLVKNNLFQFGLSPIDETQQMANKASEENFEKALLLTPNTSKGQRIAEYLTESWLQSGNFVLESQSYNAKDNDYSKPITDLLNLDESKYRHQKLQRFLAKEIGFTERRRQDVDVIFLSANVKVARSIYPQLRFYRATRIPVIATPQVYSGTPSPSQDIDLDNITFCDIPWLFPEIYTGDLSKESLRDIWQPVPNKYLRLVALGLDAFNIIPHIESMPTTPFDGATGSLSINTENKITRQLNCAKFVNGIPELTDFTHITNNSTDENMLYSDPNNE